ncbi:MAG: DEAD/DEAH box helicase, partial [Verrucomicrobium sp.]
MSSMGADGSMGVNGCDEPPPLLHGTGLQYSPASGMNPVPMPPLSTVHPDTPLDQVGGLRPSALKMLEKEGYATVESLLLHYPARHEDRRRMDFKGFSPSETPVCHHVRVLKTRVLRFGNRGGVFETVVEGAEGNPMHQQLTLRWFNMVFLQKVLAVDMELMIYGKIKEIKARMVMDHPDYEIVRGEDDDEEAGVHSSRIVPVYRLRGTLKQKPLRVAIWRALEQLDEQSLPDVLPRPKTGGEFAGLSRARALRILHHPSGFEELEQARRYLALEEFYLMQLRAVRRKLQFKQTGGKPQRAQGQLMEAFLAALPFEFTGAQKRSLDEILADMALSQPMNRLLHGDVGSGKTVVALAAMLMAVEAGQQAALMAPTQILAEQHYQNAQRWLEPLGVRVALRTGDKVIDGSAELFGNVGPTEESAESVGSARFQRAAFGILPNAPAGKIDEPNYHKRRLPHFERPWGKYMLTWSTREHRQLSNPARDIVLGSLRYFHQVRYHLYAAVVMADHVHALIEPLPESWDDGGNATFHSLGNILHSIKSFTANEINKVESEQAPVWEKESYDRLIRSESDLQEKFTYIVTNPLRAELVKGDDVYPWLWTPDEGVPQDAEHGTLEARAPQVSRSPQEPDVIIGTHALLYEREKGNLSRLGLVVIDEQHKFGVAQRARLIAQGSTPDVLVMTATPIPRTLTLTLYGDLDVSTIDQRPKERGKIITAVREITKVDEVTKFILTRLEEGRQCYVVYPLIDESEKLDLGAATTGHAEWSKRLAPHATGLLHGRMDGEAKEAVMRQFRDGKIQVLVSTTVIEVGVDVPNASVMVI